MLLTTLAGTTGHVHALAVAPAAAPLTVAGPSEAFCREIRIRVRSALVYRHRDATGSVALPREADASADLAVSLALVPEYAHGIDAAIGELSLAGQVRPVRGIIPRLEALRDAGVRRCLVPLAQLEAAAVPGIECLGLGALGEEPRPLLPWSWREPEYPSLDEVRGLDEARLEEAIAALRAAIDGGRDVLFVREPGAGATMLARRAVSLLPALTHDVRDEIARIWSASGLPVSPALGRPFRAPHHTVSVTGLVGGGRPVRPGEVSLAHGGVLFLDEVGELSRHAMAALEDALDRSQSCDMDAHPRVVIAACTEAELPRVAKSFVGRFDRIFLKR